MPERHSHGFAARYSRNQRLAHWLVVALVLVQLLFNGPMEEAFDEGVDAGRFEVTAGALLHAVTGVSILGLMAWRLAMRIGHGVPPPPDVAQRIQLLSRANHWAFYVVLLAMPPVGLLAVLTLSPTLGEFHEAAATLLIVLVVLHLSGAVFHLVRPGDRTWLRMISKDRADL